MTIATKERPIIFSGEMVRAILAKRKSQTRRVVNPERCNHNDLVVKDALKSGDVDWLVCKCPYGEPGDRLWVRETWQYNPYGGIVYRAGSGIINCDGRGWRPSIHMPRRASRILLEITGVRVERVQEISEADVYSEGTERPIVPKNDVRRWWDYQLKEWTTFSRMGCPQDSFRTLWNSINANRGFGWNENPWVWVIEFKRVQASERSACPKRSRRDADNA